ncbi:hypothetical protein HAX54_028478, partial [Datura stramonium]|nr:hypothetical protein [Datura stramonium]
ENQETIAKRRKLKKRVIVEEEVQSEIILDLEEEVVEKEVDDDVAISVLVQREKILSQPSTDGETTI